VSDWRDRRARAFDELATAAGTALDAVSDLAAACDEVGDEKAARELHATASLCRSLQHGWNDRARTLRSAEVAAPLPMIVTRGLRR